MHPTRNEMTPTEEQILNSPFLDTLRDLHFDETHYAAIVELIEALAQEWASKTVVNKRVVAELQILPSVARGTAFRLGDRKMKDRLYEVADDLETLAFICFQDEVAC